MREILEQSSVMEDVKQTHQVVTCEEEQPVEWFETVNTIRSPWRGMPVWTLPDGVPVPRDNPYVPNMGDGCWSTVPPYGGRYSTDVRKWFRKK